MIKSKHGEKALNRIFLDFHKLGFWNDEEGRIIESLYHDDNWNWQYKQSDKKRYGLFTLSMILLAEDVFNLNVSKYEKKIIRNLIWIKKNKEKFSVSEFTYGGLLCIALGYKNYNLFKKEDREITTILNGVLSKIKRAPDNQHYLVLIALKYFIDIYKDQKLLQQLETITDQLLRVQSKNGFFLTGDIRAYHHQRTMYVLWGLLFSSYYYKHNEIKIGVEKSLRWIWKNRRDGSDDGFVWHPPFYWITNRYGIRVPIYLPVSSKHLFECHQTFFVNAVNLYHQFYKNTQFQEEKNRAMSWIFGKNRINQNLIDLTLLDFSARIMSVDGRLQIKNEQFKGSYEIGSFILSVAAQN